MGDNKKVTSYKNMLKRAILEYDTSVLDYKGPLVGDVLGFSGEGELKTGDDASDILARYYFKEENEEKTIHEQIDDENHVSGDEVTDDIVGGSGAIETGGDPDSVEETMDDLEDNVSYDDDDVDGDPDEASEDTSDDVITAQEAAIIEQLIMEMELLEDEEAGEKKDDEDEESEDSDEDEDSEDSEVEKMVESLLMEDEDDVMDGAGPVKRRQALEEAFDVFKEQLDAEVAGVEYDEDGEMAEDIEDLDGELDDIEDLDGELDDIEDSLNEALALLEDEEAEDGADVEDEDAEDLDVDSATDEDIKDAEEKLDEMLMMLEEESLDMTDSPTTVHVGDYEVSDEVMAGDEPYEIDQTEGDDSGETFDLEKAEEKLDEMLMMLEDEDLSDEVKSDDEDAEDDEESGEDEEKEEDLDEMLMLEDDESEDEDAEDDEVSAKEELDKVEAELNEALALLEDDEDVVIDDEDEEDVVSDDEEDEEDEDYEED